MAVEKLVKAAVADEVGTKTETLKEAVNLVKPQLRNGAVIQDTSYTVKQSILYTNLFWRLVGDTISRATANNKFARFFKPMEVGGDLIETFIRLKSPIDRNTLSNSNLFTNYTDTIDVAVHRLNKQLVIPTTYRDIELRKIVSDWSTLSSYLGALIDNLTQSVNNYFYRETLQGLFDFYGTGQMAFHTLTTNTDKELEAKQRGIEIATIWDKMHYVSKDYIGYNKDGNKQGDIENNAKSTPVLIITAELARSIEFMAALELHFGRSFLDGNDNQDFYKKVIVVDEFPTTVVDGSTPTGSSYVAPSNLGTVKAMLVDEEFFVFRNQFQTTIDFQNAITLNTTVALHNDSLMSFSPFKKAVAFVE